MKPIGCEIHTTSYRDYFDMVLGLHPCVFSKTVYFVDFEQHRLSMEGELMSVRAKASGRLFGVMAAKSIKKVIWKYPGKKTIGKRYG